jgi:hypothetical protein
VGCTGPLRSDGGLRQWIRAAALAMAALGLACVTARSRGYPLYPSTTGRLDETRVARLGGYVHFVDGQDISALGGQFELLPGCHVIGTPALWGGSTLTGRGTVRAHTGEVTFALPMKAGYQYTVEVVIYPGLNGGRYTHVVRAFEQDAQGAKTRTFKRAPSSSTIEACRDEADEESPPGAEDQEVPDGGASR